MNKTILEQIEIDKTHIDDFPLETEEGTKRYKEKFHLRAANECNTYINREINIFQNCLENIENDDKSVVVLRFNPWLCTDSKQLISQFIKQLATAIELKIPNGDRVWEIIARYADLFDAAGAIPYVGSLVSAAGNILGREANAQVSARSEGLQKRPAMKSQV